MSIIKKTTMKNVSIAWNERREKRKNIFRGLLTPLNLFIYFFFAAAAEFFYHFYCIEIFIMHRNFFSSRLQQSMPLIQSIMKHSDIFTV